MPKLYLFVILLLFFHPRDFAQQPTQDSLDKKWSFTVAGYYYFIPYDNNTFTLISNASYKRLRLEARYNYEDVNTVSLFGGRSFEFGGKLQVEAIPMLGALLGNTNGMAPGVELDLSYGKFNYYSETEYVIDFDGKENNFFYVWGELGFYPVEAFRFGYSYQKTRLYQSSRSIQNGAFAEYTFRKFSIGGYYFDPFTSDNFFVISLKVDF